MIGAAMNGRSALFSLVVLVLVVLAVCYALSMLGFYIFMRSGPDGLPPLHGSVRERKAQLFKACDAGVAWFAKRDHRTVAAVASTIAAWGFMLAAVSGRGTDFGRSGALISILGLVVTFIGSVHARGLFELRYAVDAAAATRDKPDTDERAEGLSRVWMAIIIATGTLIWGYGDLAFDAISAHLCQLRVSWVNRGCSIPPLSPPPPRSRVPAQRFLVLFDWNSATVQPAAEEIIIAAAQDALKDTKPLVCLVGRADASGPSQYNLTLSEHRANAVNAELSKLGLNTEEVKVSFKGSDDLVVSSASKTREMLNRNVEIFIDHGSASTHCK
jgi:outer membrane protein OmpA-like peptidoglycan-associated protein